MARLGQARIPAEKELNPNPKAPNSQEIPNAKFKSRIVPKKIA
jgi:hypothetical protein